jgi:hypothetical protein
MQRCILLAILACFLATNALKLSVPNRLLSAALVGLSLNVPINFEIATMMGPVHNPFITEARADFRAAQKRTYFRFVPKLIIGRDFYKTDLKQAIEKGDWATVEKMFDVYVTKYNPNDPGQIDKTDRYVDAFFLRPMTVFSGSFAEKGVSPKQTAMMKQEEVFAAAMGELEGCVKDRKGAGFFDPVIKSPTGDARKKQATEAYASGKTALNEYIRLANEGLMRELNTIDTI